MRLSFLSLVSPVRAIRDLRAFLAHRQKHELVFFVLAVAITMLIIVGFYKDSSFEKPYQREIIYVENWRADRTDAEIYAKQRYDWYVKARRDADRELRKQRSRESFKKVDDKLESWGL